MTPLPTLADCWNRVGVAGDRSCPELAEHVHCHNCPVFATAARSFFDRPPPAGYREEWAAELARPAPSAGAGVTAALLFRAAGEWLALPARALAEVTEPRPTRRVPHRTGGLLVGLTNIRGQLHLCVSLHRLLGLGEPAESTARRYVVVGPPADRWVFSADEVRGVEAVPHELLGKVPGTLANPARAYSRAVFPWRGRHVGLLDEARVLDGFRGGLGS